MFTSPRCLIPAAILAAVAMPLHAQTATPTPDAAATAAATASDATDPPITPTSKPMSSAIRADMGSNNDDAMVQRSRASNSRRRAGLDRGVIAELPMRNGK